MKPCVSVVVPTYKRPELLARCLDALLAQDFNAEDYEIIVADDAGCADTRQQVTLIAEKARQQRSYSALYPCSICLLRMGLLLLAMWAGARHVARLLPSPMMIVFHKSNG